MTQIIRLDNPNDAVVFTEDNKVFYNLAVLIYLYDKNIHTILNANPDLTDAERAYLLGQHDLLNNIVEDAQTLLLGKDIENLNIDDLKE